MDSMELNSFLPNSISSTKQTPLLFPSPLFSALVERRAIKLQPNSSSTTEAEKMACPPKYAQLCHLINNSLHSYTEPPLLVSPVPKETEKQLLITLSQVSRVIASWDGYNDQKCEPHHDVEQDSGDCHNCLSSIVLLLVTFLTVESQYVQHSTGNVLVLISDFHTKSRCYDTLHKNSWGEKTNGFVRLFCICLEMAMSNILFSSSEFLGTIDSGSATSSFTRCAQERLENANWFTVAGLIRVLRTILKHLKQDPDDELLKIYMHSVSRCLTNVPWELLNETHMSRTREAHISSSTSVSHGKIGTYVSRFIFLGALLQLLCSLVQPSSSTEVGHGTFHEHHVLYKFTDITSKVIYWCFCKLENQNGLFNSQYMRHKMLMLMIRLSVQVHQDFSTLVMLFQLLWKYFEDLLHLPVSGKCIDLDECLEESPFFSCFIDQEDTHKISIRHLQRQAIFLFLKCSFSLISVSEGTNKECSRAASDPGLCFELQSGSYCCTEKKVMLKLSEWLQRHVPREKFTNYEVYLEKCGNFAKSFLQLFMDEDDLLFEVLLHLSTVSLPSEQMEYKEKDTAFEEAKKDAIFLLSNILHPVHLFHIFLAELHYDHVVLLDYLISKDAGIPCLQYLLRSLRAVCNSWNLFMEFQLCEEGSSLHLCKKRKITWDRWTDSEEKVELSSLLRNSGVLDEGSKRHNKHGRADNDAFTNAQTCLLSLKKSVENLHQKNLFPYNPAALLRSFTRFEELCLQQQKLNLSKTGSMI